MIDRDYIRTYLKVIYLKSTKRTHGGYIWFMMPQHPYCTGQGYIYEHRFLMELKLGRYLTKTEIVHHIDGNRSNNNIKNLFLFQSHSKHITNHNLEREYIRTDNSGRICLLCDNTTPKINIKGFPIWNKFENGWICDKCKGKLKYFKIISCITPNCPIC